MNRSPRSPNPYAAGATPPAAPQRPPRRRARTLLRALALAALALLAWLWWWTGSAGSLALVLDQAARHLPPGQSLQAQGVAGSLRAGGRVDTLRWSNERIALELRGLRIAWRLAPLLQGRLRLDELHAAQLSITPVPGAPPAPDTASEPLRELRLPLSLVLPFAIDRITWNGGAAPVHVTGLAGSYRYDGGTHRLDVDSVALAQGSYRLQAQLQAQAPMALQVQASGTLQSPVPGIDQPVAVQARAQVQGTLSGSAARLQLHATLQGAPEGAAAPVHAEVQAQVAPWAGQPLLQAQADLQALDLAALWPQAPRTQLGGSVQLAPQDAGGWHVQAQLTNTLPGPWDLQRLPVAALQASASYDGARWQVPSASIALGQGRVQLQGSYTPAQQALQGRLQIDQVNPALLHSRLAPAPLSGTASADADTSVPDGAAVRFAAALRTTAPRQSQRAGKAPAWPRLDSLAAQGRWHGQQLELAQLDAVALQARLSARQLRIDTRTLAAQGTLQLQLPGTRADLQGSLAPAAGDGTLRLKVTQAEATQRWLAGLGDWLPLPAALRDWRLAGDAGLDLRWHGGWQASWQALAQQRGHGAQAGLAPANALALQAELASKQLRLAHTANSSTDSATGDAAASAPITLQGARITLQGSLAQAALTLAGTLRQGDAQGNNQAVRQASLQAQASAGLQRNGRWQASLDGLQVQATLPGQRAPWAVQLEQPVAVALQPAPRLQVQVGAGALRLSGPQPGAALLRWQPSSYAVQAGGRAALRSQGTLAGLPLAWANAAARQGQPLLASLGLGGDLLLAGAWDVDTTAAQPRLLASLQRSGGDLHLLPGADGMPLAAMATGADAAAGTPLGVSEAALHLSVAGQALQARLVWRSAQAGTLQAQAGTQLAQGQDGAPWQWPQDAPLHASLHAALPELGLWSALAPPGWRVRGTLAADVRLSGSRAAPQWSGTLAADRFAVRSLLDGVDLQEGRLRATLQGQQLRITEFALQGGHGSGARIAGYSGNRTDAPSDGGNLNGSGTIAWSSTAGTVPAITMDVQAQARALQLLVRADRQVSVSGALRARLAEGQLTLQGDLSTDRAAIMLPEAGAPALDDDVAVRRGPPAATTAAAPAASTRAARPPIVDLRLDLGRDFAVQGYGLTTRLRGKLAVRSDADTPLQVNGEVRTDQGRYRAWGQALDVESGLLRFSGSYDNPQLDILALRPNISVRAGVQVSGTAQAPRVRLYSEPDMADAEKLSWVVLGKSAAGGGAEAALMQQAALALLGGKGSPTAGVARSLGLDEIGFKGPQDGAGASSAALTLGKRLSRNLYVSYERSLSGVLGTLSIFYDLTRHLTLRGQTGGDSAVDLVYTVRYD